MFLNACQSCSALQDLSRFQQDFIKIFQECRGSSHIFIVSLDHRCQKHENLVQINTYEILGFVYEIRGKYEFRTVLYEILTILTKTHYVN